MKKLTDFIINKRYFILGIFIIFSVICAFLETKVKINHDMAEYLPDSSETRMGNEIMEKEFGDTVTSTLNLMFKGLSSEEKLKIKEELENIEEVSEVEYDESSNYNKDDYTLYAITVEDEADSKAAATLYQEISKKYKDYTFYTSGGISENNKSVLPFWIVVLAVVSALIILLIMCESYVEPFLFLTSILIAVLLNKGTNIIFSSVSNITVSITAILQMALSMDYSIMLMNRYDQEKKKEKDIVVAMKNALYKAFQAISSSSVTTIVGLLSLVFMSFKIGKDLGFVLAKGVLFSLLCIFFVLPALILIFDKWIVKTKKKSPVIKLDKLGSFSYKLRYLSAPLFLLIFVVSFILKGNLGINYTDSESDEVSKVFKENNQMAIIYRNKDEESISKLLSNFENNKNIDEVLGYGNTINQNLTYDKVNDKLNDLGYEKSIEDYLLKIVYYDYYNKDNENMIMLDNFLDFIKSEVYFNPKASKKIDNQVKMDIDRLSNFTNRDSMLKSRTKEDIADILQIEDSKLKDIYIYYLSLNNNTLLSLEEFVNFINRDVLTNSEYSSGVSLSSIERITNLVNKDNLTSKLSSEEIADLLDLDKKLVNDLYNYYISLNNEGTLLTIHEFADFMLNTANNDTRVGDLSIEEINSLKLLYDFSDTSFFMEKKSVKELSQIFGVDEALVQLIAGSGESPYDFVNYILSSDMIKGMIDQKDDTLVGKLEMLSTVMKSSLNGEKLSYEDLSKIILLDKDTLKDIYVLYAIYNSELKLSLEEFVNFLLEHKEDEALKEGLKDNISSLYFVSNIIDSVKNNKTYSSYEISDFLGIDRENADLLYGLYTYNYVNSDIEFSLKDIVSFILNNVVTNQKYSSRIGEDELVKLKVVDKVMNDSLNNRAYTSKEVFDIISSLGSNIDSNTLDMLYVYYGSSREFNNEWELTIEKFVNYLNDSVIKDKKFIDYIEEDTREDIVDSLETINEAKELLVGKEYSRVVLNTKFNMENKETFDFISNTKDMIESEVSEFYIIGDSPMALEMSKSFDSELNTITIITMILIFVVVAVTFKSIIIPIILVLTIQTAVFTTMGILSIIGENVYFISILIVQSILMGATIDYAILYTSYYLEHRKTLSVKESIIASYNKSINTILTSSSILIIVTLIIANFASQIAAKICKTISEGTLCSTILIIFLLPSVLAFWDKVIVRNKK